MHFELSADTNEGILSLSGELTLLQAEQLKMHLARALEASERLYIDTEELADIDLACLQLICSAHRSAANQGKQLDLTRQKSDAFTAKIVAAGLLNRCGCDAVGASDCLWKGGKQ